MASPQRRPTAETGYSSGRFLKLDNKSKTRIIFFHFFSCIPPAGRLMSQYLEPLATLGAQFTDWPRGKSAIFRFRITQTPFQIYSLPNLKMIQMFLVFTFPRPSISNVIWILYFDTICQLNQLFSNIEVAMLSTKYHPLHNVHFG